MINERLKPPHKGRFIILDDINERFYDVDYDAADNPAMLNNRKSWEDLALHRVEYPTIILPGEQWTGLHLERLYRAKGFIVALDLDSREDDILQGTTIGSVFVRPADQKQMNWPALRSARSEELASEMKAGLLRHLWDKSDKETAGPISYVTPAHVLEGMKSDWHCNGESLNSELDHQFVGGKVIERHQKWRLRFAH